MMSSEKIAEFFLVFNHQTTILPLIIVGFTLYKRNIFGHALSLLLFTMIFNSFLKSIFQIPLSPALSKEGFAFPSGHMQASIVFYGWLMMTLAYLSLRIFLSFLVAAIGWSLVYRGYHNWLDIGGAFAFGLLSLSGYKVMTRHFTKPYQTGLVLVCLSVLMLSYLHKMTKIPSHAWMAFYALIGFTGAWAWNIKSVKETSRWQEKGLALCLCLLGLILIYLFFQQSFLKELPFYIWRLQYFLAAFCLPLSLKFARRKKADK